ncbi:hypothetical protein D623_10012446 [Myotis brandtii]|uniref:Uncharacterized protein n=1 Tax=Myotis brandtii TaxID=109478 RepID=S7Q1U3_MYOBR|nr:hypothetical protein D623_10012446 [Myotis brandtii]
MTTVTRATACDPLRELFDPFCEKKTLGHWRPETLSPPGNLPGDARRQGADKLPAWRRHVRREPGRGCLQRGRWAGRELCWKPHGGAIILLVVCA